MAAASGGKRLDASTGRVSAAGVQTVCGALLGLVVDDRTRRQPISTSGTSDAASALAFQSQSPSASPDARTRSERLLAARNGGSAVINIGLACECNLWCPWRCQDCVMVGRARPRTATSGGSLDGAGGTSALLALTTYLDCLCRGAIYHDRCFPFYDSLSRPARRS